MNRGRGIWEIQAEWILTHNLSVTFPESGLSSVVRTNAVEEKGKPLRIGKRSNPLGSPSLGRLSVKYSQPDKLIIDRVRVLRTHHTGAKADVLCSKTLIFKACNNANREISVLNLPTKTQQICYKRVDNK